MELKENERIDDLQYKGLKIIQNDVLFRFGTDAVLLANFCEAKKGERVVDFGTGTGIIPLLLHARTGADVIGIEIQKGAASLAKRNVALNAFSSHITVVEGDIQEATKLIKGHIHAIVCNPPYERGGSGAVSEREEIRIARHEVLCNLESIIKSASKLLSTAGRFYMIHRASRTAELISAMCRYQLEPKVIRFICGKEGKEPSLVLVKGVKDAKPGVLIRENLIVSDKENRETEEIKEIYHRRDYE